MSRKYKVIIFDWDGTLMDSDRRIVACLKEGAMRADLPLLPDQAYKSKIGLSLQTVIRELYPLASHWQQQVMDAVYRWQFMEAHDEPMLPFKGMKSLLENLLAAGYLLAIATGKSRAGLESVLVETSVRDLFHLTKSGEETACKPDPLMLQQILDELSLRVDEALMVGDSIFDLEMAQRIGMDAVAMTHGVHGLEELLNYAPVKVCDDLAELESYLLIEMS